MNALTRDAAHWRGRAACATETAAWWDLIGGDGPNAEGKLTEANRAAIRICAGCPVARQCFDEALDLRDHGSVRGGIPLFKPMERFRCVDCGKAGLRITGRTGHRSQKHCGDRCRNNARRKSGQAAAQRQLEVAA